MNAPWDANAASELNRALGGYGLLHRGEPELIKACMKRDLGSVTKLIFAGAEINARGPSGMTALMTAIANQDPAIISRLLSAKPDLDAKSAQGVTALMLAADRGDNASISQLLEAGATMQIRDAAGQTARDRAERLGIGCAVSLLDAYAKYRAARAKQDELKRQTLLTA